MADSPAAFGAVMRERRRGLQLTQEQLATMAGVSREDVIYIESGKPTAQWPIALRMAKALGLNVNLRPR